MVGSYLEAHTAMREHGCRVSGERARVLADEVVRDELHGHRGLADATAAHNN